MLQEQKPEADYGVIVGRFQVPSLHEGHKQLIDSVLSRHKHVVVFVGVNGGARLTRDDPLEFHARFSMIHDEYSGLLVLPLPDHPCDTEWSKNLDDMVRVATCGRSAILYGSRDGFIPYYSGKYKTVELECKKDQSGTDIRRQVANEVVSSEDFRRGVIYAAHSRFPTSFQVVDVAVFKDSDTVLLCRKASDPKGKLRFVGGFVDPTDASLEMAAKREVSEETGLETLSYKYIGSSRIEDWRYRGQGDKMMSAFFTAKYMFGSVKAMDDIQSAGWYSLKYEGFRDRMIDSHKPLVDLLLKGEKDDK